jgi:hypothetical protein
VLTLRARRFSKIKGNAQLNQRRESAKAKENVSESERELLNNRREVSERAKGSTFQTVLSIAIIHAKVELKRKKDEKALTLD